MMNPYVYSGDTSAPVAPSAGLERDQASLRLLSLFHFIYASVAGLAGLLVLATLAIGCSIASAIVHFGKMPAAGLLIGGTLATALVAIAALIFAPAAVVFLSGMGLHRGEARWFSRWVAWLTLINVPLGTVLGIYTLRVLSRPSVQAFYRSRVV
jgi:hypothetical protein